MAVDGPLPDADIVERAARAGVAALALCGGAPAGPAAMAAADRLGLTMVLAGTTEPRQ